MKYKLETAITPGGCGYIKVWNSEAESGNRHGLIWTFMPKSNNSELVLAEMISENALVAVDRNATISLHDVLERNEINSKECFGKQPVGALVADENQTLLVGLTPKNGGDSVLLVIDMPTLNIQAEIQLSDKAQPHTLCYLDDGVVLMVFQPGGAMGGNTRDGFYKINYRQNIINSFCFSSSPSGDLSIPPILFCPEKGIGIRPCYDKIEVSRRSETIRYLAKVQLFSLDDAKEIRTITVREFLPEHVFEDDDPETALSYLELPAASEDYTETRDEFLERIDSFAVCRTEDAFWVAFQHGLIRKISFDGRDRSPLIAHPGDVRYQRDDPYYRTHFDTPISISEDDKTIVFGKPCTAFSTDNVDLNVDREIIVLPPSESVLQPRFSTQEEDDFSWVTIPLGDFGQMESFEKALDSMLQLSSDIEAIRDGKLLRFRFACGDTIVPERSFFEELSKYPDTMPTVGKYIRNLCHYGAPLWYDETTVAGVFALRVLVLSDKMSVKDLIAYLSSGIIDAREEYEEPGRLMEEVVSYYGWSRDLVDAILTRAVFQTDKGLDQLQAYLKTGEFQAYMVNPDHLKYFRNHTLFKSLSEDYFQMLMPLEDELFEAIEDEDLEMVEDIVEKGAELEARHPDFQATPLELAFERENRKIISLLIKAGATTDGLDIDDFAKVVLQRETAFTKDEKENVRITLEALYRKRDTIQDQISKIEFNHMLSFSIGEDRLRSLEELNSKLDETNREIRYAKIGLSKTGEGPLEDFRQSIQYKKTVMGRLDRETGEFIRDNSYFEENPKAATVVVEDFGKNGSFDDAMEQLAELSRSPDRLIVGDRLRFTFKDKHLEMDEKTFFERLPMTHDTAERLRIIFANIVGGVSGELWYDDEIQAGMYAMKSLVLYDKKYIADFIEYLKSGIINYENETLYPTELIFDVLEKFGWCDETLRLIVARAVNCGGRYGSDEFRLQVKKGGLREYLQNGKHFDLFHALLLQEAGEDDPEKIELLCKMVKDKENI
ncbi:MAG: ankyrin repeat domain-containing protein [Proteobacteria bacterium]|nr:ankyrin repeat domain-containing protein [Pseudomonadota bacterium]